MAQFARVCFADVHSKDATLSVQELLATACESVVAADALSALRCGAFSSSGSVESGGRPESVRRRRTLESEDSSYDSDTENPGDTTSSTRQHEDVSRTVSDTLGAEFAEYVTAGPQYASRLEFAVKLGYTEQQVQQALRRLGPQPAQNELLAELVRLGAREQTGDSAAPRADQSSSQAEDPLRPIVIDGSNVAMSHGNKEVFSCRGIKLAVDWFRDRDQEILLQLEKERLLFFTPSRNVGGKRMVCYEDRYILKMAAQTGGVVVSNDNYRDLVAESLDFKRVVEERLLMYTFVNDRFMPPDDPLGRHGPSLDAFLRKSGTLASEGPPSCPYGKKCTYGNKCKYYHPERGNLPQKSVTERLAEQARLQLQEVKARSVIKSRDSSPGGELLKTKSLPPGASEAMLPKKKMPLSRTKSSVPSLLGADLLEADGGGHLSVAKATLRSRFGTRSILTAQRPRSSGTNLMPSGVFEFRVSFFLPKSIPHSSLNIPECRVDTWVASGPRRLTLDPVSSNARNVVLPIRTSKSGFFPPPAADATCIIKLQ
ncbi:hypothetical protein MRX96_025917 [Rhipicephalus microplus]